MKKIILFFFIALNTANFFSQETPKVVLKDSTSLRLTHLKIKVEITGNFATTTYDMKFFNEPDRTLEGELVFPLGEGQTVSKFAMDINGKLRDAVVVEKELARVAFESTVRQNIDPALLEKVQGNNYKARVYPILPHSYKHIVITYEQELFTTGNFQTYELPLGFNEKLDEFSVQMVVNGEEHLPIIKGKDHKNFFFTKKDNYFSAEVAKQNFVPINPITVQIPNPVNTQTIITYNDYFYLHQALKPGSRLKTKPRKITLLWDTSSSLKHRNLEEELKLLGNYFRYLQNVQVQFIAFSNAIHKNEIMEVSKGEWKEIEQLIRNTVYDGGTSLDLFKELKIKSDETLLFTDGLDNLGSFTSYNNSALYTINSTVSANHENLKNIANRSGGNYINLVRLNYTDALRILKQETYRFLGIEQNDKITEVYPGKNTNVTTDFSLAGRFSGKTSINLLFGYQGKVTERITVAVKNTLETKQAKRLWAKKKLQFLNEDKKNNKEAIINHALQYHLISDYTSMLILDRVEDYVRYRIEPPLEFMEEYKEQLEEIADNKADREADLNERKEWLYEDYANIREWYNTKFPKKEAKKEKKVQTSNVNSTEPQTENIEPPQDNVETASQRTNPITETRVVVTDSTKRIIRGIIVDNEGQPLSGVNVLVSGTTTGTLTDFDGNFEINATGNDELVFSYIGFGTKSQVVGNSNTMNVSLEEDTQHLDEVVIVGYEVTKQASITGSVTSIVHESLAGRVSGIQVTGAAGSASSVSLKETTPLYIIDGVISKENPLEKFTSEEIENIQVYNAENGTKLYGSQASGGLMIITTKKGKETHREAIDELEEKIADRIELKSWNPETPYIKILQQAKTTGEAYKKYLEIKDEYSNSPSFYLDVADFFDRKKSSQLAITILTNLMETELDNYELMKALAYKLEYFKQYNLAVIVYNKVLELRPEEPQSYRDLALAYEQAGEYQKSFDLLYKIYSCQLLEKDEDERFYGIEHIAFVELTRLVSKYGNKLKLNKTQKEEFTEMPVDVRVVIDWNHNDTDIDLWVIDPEEEKAYYSNPETKIGGRMSEDLTEGYGPEEFMLKNAIKGNYKVMVDYYSDNVQKISGPTILKVTMFTNYGRSTETKKTITVRLDKEEDEIEVGNFKI
ncbi:VIT domain-containing protein [Abyssalbus ytuae]|uniref:Carboxypeptidase-like regulatory domain-containing protein n=1 Tax=Abyssalbus ytuae TaxID=2926907 RepID=A0A9E6ZRS3_9FLAO|nr:VIT domain-containing protein [Abyssalbus ytuae]UOB19365.1 carboxypeptidase-like regulatory domain-containing protein [Abyssalbus ytuae]